MAMIKASEVTPRKFRAIVPDAFKNCGYTELKEGMTIEIESVIFSVYQATKKVNDTRVELKTQDGKPITNVTAYIGLGDGKYTSVNGDVAICQLASLTGFDKEEIGQYTYDLPKPETATCIIVKEPMGDKEFPKIAFE